MSTLSAIRLSRSVVSSSWPSKYEIALFWAGVDGTDVPDVELDFPACFACYYSHPHWRRPRGLERRWHRARLDRAHIVARNSGGTNLCSNFVLLCDYCHERAPMVNHPRYMLRWVTRQRTWDERFDAEVRDLLEVFEITRSTASLSDQAMIDRSFKTLGGGMHFSRKSGSHISPATVVAALAHSTGSF